VWVQAAVRRLGFRVCIVWAASSSTYVEVDRINESVDPPAVGFTGAELEFEAQRYRPSEPPSDDALDLGSR
jgi:hypothetical protein